MNALIEALQRAGLASVTQKKEEVENWHLFAPDDPDQRELVFEGGVFSLKVPEKAPVIEGKFIGHEYSEVGTWSIHGGGYIKKYLHPANKGPVAPLRGKRIRARIELWKKTYQAGNGSSKPRSFFYVDYHPIEAPSATKVIRVFPSLVVPEQPKGMAGELIKFRTPAPLTGVVIIGDVAPCS